MKHDDARSSGQILDGVFGDSIVAMSTCATVMNGLIAVLQRVTKILGGAHSIVSATSLHFNSCLCSVALKSQFGLDRFMSGKTNLIFNV